MQPYRAKVIFDYKAVEGAELSVTKDEILVIEEENDSGWCLGKKEGTDEAGWLPRDYVEPMGAAPAAAAPAAPAAPDAPDLPDPPAPAASKPAAVSQPVKQAVAAAVSAGSKTCAKCGKAISGAFVTAGAEQYHADCFSCSNCQTNLAGKAYIKEDNNIWCEKCYQTNKAEKCGYCQAAITGPFIQALNKSWHPDHFVCTECGAPFEGNSFYKHDDKPYCEKHYNLLFSENCAKCGRGIEGEVFEALERKYHLDCFTCTVGDHKIGAGINFHLYDEKVYCTEHFQELFLQRCAGCNDIIKGQYIKVLDSVYHPECWKCSDCGTVINSSNCAQSGGKFFCTKCGDKKASGGGGAARPAGASVAPSPSKVSAPAAGGDAKRSAAPSVSQAAPGSKYYPVATLTSGGALPAGVDANRKEDYINDDEFMMLFKMDRASFAKLPGWKQKRMKQKLNL